MMNKRKQVFIAVFGMLLIIFFIGCWQPANGRNVSALNPSILPKLLLTTDTPVEAILYVDTEKDNPLNAKDYVLKSGGGNIQLFNYVVLGYSYLTKDAYGFPHLEFTPSLKYILDNAMTYIKPLHEKGIKVIVEVRSGNYDDSEDGVQMGLGTLDIDVVEIFVKQLRAYVDKYGIDGFDFNDVGGGKLSYPPFTRNLTSAVSGESLYDDLFVDEDGNPLNLPPEDEEAVLWMEGGSNLSNLLQRTREALRDRFFHGPGMEDDMEVLRNVFVRNNQHGEYLLQRIRGTYRPDAYTGQQEVVANNLAYVVNDRTYDGTKLHPSFWIESNGRDDGLMGLEDKRYAPFAIDLQGSINPSDLNLFRDAFLYRNANTLSPANKYGGLYFTSLKAVSEFDSTEYLSFFSQAFFGLSVERSGSADYKKTW